MPKQLWIETEDVTLFIIIKSVWLTKRLQLLLDLRINKFQSDLNREEYKNHYIISNRYRRDA